jgi:hypothetical protein
VTPSFKFATKSRLKARLFLFPGVGATPKKFKGAADRHFDCAQHNRPSTGGGERMAGRPVKARPCYLFRLFGFVLPRSCLKCRTAIFFTRL